MPNLLKFEVVMNVPIHSLENSEITLKKVLQRVLDSNFPNYGVAVTTIGFVNMAKLIKPEDILSGGEIFYASFGDCHHYLIRSSEQKKQDLVLPEHIFHKRFRYAKRDFDVNEWCEVFEVV